MPSYVYELPTSGAFSFTESCDDMSRSNTANLAEATSARANLRTILKDSKRTDGEKDYLRVIKTVDEYLPYLYALIDCIQQDVIAFKSDPVFSWRSTLSNHIINSSPRRLCPGLQVDLVFTLLTYAYALSNLSASVVSSLGMYESDRGISEAERKTKDERLNFAANLLCRASGVFAHIAETLLPDWERHHNSLESKPPELSSEVVGGLAKLALADARVLSIRKFMSKAMAESAMTPGPPLPKSHPPAIMIAKLYLSVSTLYSSAKSLVKTPAGASSESAVDSDIRAYLSEESAVTTALAHKWLGVDAGAHDTKMGEAVGFLSWARSELEGLKEGKARLLSIAKGGDKGRVQKKDRLKEEIDSVRAFLDHYKNMNDSVLFLPVPLSSEMQSLIPAGRAVLEPKVYQAPAPTFGPRSGRATTRHVDPLQTHDEPDNEHLSQSRRTESGARTGDGGYY